jgi:hypothetical protein
VTKRTRPIPALKPTEEDKESKISEVESRIQKKKREGRT